MTRSIMWLLWLSAQGRCNGWQHMIAADNAFLCGSHPSRATNWSKPLKHWKNMRRSRPPKQSSPAARQLQCTWQWDQSSRPVWRVNGGKGWCRINGGGSNQCAWTLSMQLDPMQMMAIWMHPPPRMRKGGGLPGHGDYYNLSGRWLPWVLPTGPAGCGRGKGWLHCSKAERAHNL